MLLTKEAAETKAKFYDLVRQEFPNVGEPGVVWVLTHVLGWEWDKIKSVSIEGFDRHGYRVIMHGEKYHVVRRNWTKDEKSKLRDWWWLLGF